jgi:hypothetical protein
VHRVHRRTLFRVLRKGKCRREDTHRVVEYSVGSARCASSRRMPGGCREFSFQENFSDLSLAKYSVAQGVCEGGLILSPEAQEEQCLCTQSSRRKEQKVEKLFEVSQSTKLRSLAFWHFRVRGLERQGILESLHRELLVHEIVPAVGSGVQWPESRWITDTCTGGAHIGGAQKIRS